MAEYTPTTERMRREYLEAIADRGFADLYAAEWDRWLEQTIREAKSAALEEAAHSVEATEFAWGKIAFTAHLRDRAAGSPR